VFGPVSVTERVWRTEQKNYLRLLPEAIGVTPRGRSQRLERVLTDFGIEHSFQHAAARVLEHYGFEMNVSAVRNATLHHAGRAEQILRTEYQEPFRVLPAVGQSYIIAQAETNDGNTHNVSLYFDISGEWANGNDSTLIKWGPKQVTHAGGTLQVHTITPASPRC